ncbi:MAG: hypothetical protein SNI45_05360 [Rikenellaceae bacterium]
MKKILLFICALIFAISCEKNEESWSLNETKLTMYSGDTFLLEPNVDGCTFESESPLVAYVDDSGLITAYTAGQTNIKVYNGSSVLSCSVTVSTLYNYFTEPCVDFGCSTSTVKAYESRALYSESSESLMYTGENSYLNYAMYLLSDGYMTSSACVTPNSTLSETLNFYNERYVLLDVDTDNLNVTWVSADGQIFVYLQCYTSYTLVMYIANSSSSAPSKEVDKIMSNLNLKVDSNLSLINVDNTKTLLNSLRK